MDYVSEGRRTAMTQIFGTPSLVTTVSISQVATSTPAFASIPDPRPTTDDLRRIYDAGAVGYETVYTESVVSKALDFSALRTKLLERASGDVLEKGNAVQTFGALM
jgi:hypothetical protein